LIPSYLMNGPSGTPGVAPGGASGKLVLAGRSHVVDFDGVALVVEVVGRREAGHLGDGDGERELDRSCSR